MVWPPFPHNFLRGWGSLIVPLGKSPSRLSKCIAILCLGTMGAFFFRSFRPDKMSHKNSDKKIIESVSSWVTDNSQSPKYARIKFSNLSMKTWMTKKNDSQTWIEGDSWKVKCLNTRKRDLPATYLPQWYCWWFRNVANQDLSKEPSTNLNCFTGFLHKDTINIRQNFSKSC